MEAQFSATVREAIAEWLASWTPREAKPAYLTFTNRPDGLYQGHFQPPQANCRHQALEHALHLGHLRHQRVPPKLT